MTENELLEEIARELILPEMEDNEVTAHMVADYTGQSVSQAMRYLIKQEQAGVFASRRVKLVNGKVAKAWHKIGTGN